MTTKIKAIAVNINNEICLVFPYDLADTNYYSYCDSWDAIGGHGSCHVDYTESKYRVTNSNIVNNLIEYYEKTYDCKIQLLKRVNHYKAFLERENQYQSFSNN